MEAVSVKRSWNLVDQPIDLKQYDTLIDGFGDVGASPMPIWALNARVHKLLESGVPIRLPQAVFHETRDVTLPKLLGEHLIGNWQRPIGDDIRVTYGTGGAEAIEIAVKLARKATGKKWVLGVEGDFHGRSQLCLSIQCGPAYHHNGFGPGVECAGYIVINFDADEGLHSDRRVIVWPQMILASMDEIAAIVISPVNGNNTLGVWPDSLWSIVSDIQDGGGLVIFDEIQTGFGRAGGVVSYVGTEHWTEHCGILPDIFVFGKGAAMGFPQSIVAARDEIVSDNMTLGTHFSTMAGSPMACELTKQYIDDLDGGLLYDAMERAERIAAAFPMDINRIGCMMSIQSKSVTELCAKAKDAGLFLFAPRSTNRVRLTIPMWMGRHDEDILISILSVIGVK